MQGICLAKQRADGRYDFQLHTLTSFAMVLFITEFQTVVDAVRILARGSRVPWFIFFLLVKDRST
jgi:hypothetical protein